MGKIGKTVAGLGFGSTTDIVQGSEWWIESSGRIFWSLSWYEDKNTMNLYKSGLAVGNSTMK